MAAKLDRRRRPFFTFGSIFCAFSFGRGAVGTDDFAGVTTFSLGSELRMGGEAGTNGLETRRNLNPQSSSRSTSEVAL